MGALMSINKCSCTRKTVCSYCVNKIVDKIYKCNKCTKNDTCLSCCNRLNELYAINALNDFHYTYV